VKTLLTLEIGRYSMVNKVGSQGIHWKGTRLIYCNDTEGWSYYTYDAATFEITDWLLLLDYPGYCDKNAHVGPPMSDIVYCPRILAFQAKNSSALPTSVIKA